MNRDVVTIPIRDRSKKPEVAYSKHDGVIVINITKPEQAECFICKFCSVTQNSLTRLEKHKEKKHGNEKFYFYQIDDCVRVVCNIAGTDASSRLSDSDSTCLYSAIAKPNMTIKTSPMMFTDAIFNFR